MAGYRGWESLILRGVGAPVTRANVRALDAWQRAEGGNASFNPLNTTQPASGAGSYNGVGVRNYGSAQQGTRATVDTLLNGHYGPIVSDLRHSAAPARTAHDVGASPWGTSGSLIQSVLGSPGHSTVYPAAPQTRAAPESGSAYPARAAPDNHQQVALALLKQVGQKTPDYSQVFGLLEQRGAAPAAAPPMPSPSPRGMPTAPPAPHGGVSITGQLGGLNPHFEQELEQAVGAAGGTKIRVDSGYRSPAHNAAVGGVPHSNHTTGDAADGSAYVPGQGWVPLGTLLRSSAPRFGLRSGDQPGFYNGGRDPVHVDDGRNQGRHR